MLVESSLGALLQGVSQQPARLRMPGQVTEQINFVSDISTGLTSRPPTEHINILANAEPGMQFHDISFQGNTYIFGCLPGELYVWNDEGNAIDVSYVQSEAQDYIGTNMRFHVFGAEIIAVNRNVTTAIDATVTGYSEHFAIVSSLGGAFSRTYELTYTFAGGVTKVATCNTPDGTDTGDALETSSDAIMETLRLSLIAAGLPSGYTASRQADVLLVRGPAAISVAVTDGDSGSVLRGIGDTAVDRTYLPRFAPNGAVVKIVGDEDRADDYWLQFTIPGESAGAGFGLSGVWVEYRDVTTPHGLDLETWPHVLRIVGGDFTVRQGDYYDRRVGDADSNPFPSIIGSPIRDVAGFEGRLVFAGGSSVIMSRTNTEDGAFKGPHDFFRKSVTLLADSDPIDMSSTVEGTITLDWIVPFDRDLIVLSDPGDSQFIITGGGITPSTASMVLTTSYEISGGAKPVTTGRTLVFPFIVGGYSGIKEFFTNDSIATNGADTLTEVQNRYIPDSVVHMCNSKHNNIVLLQVNSTAGITERRTIWVYKYLWEGTDRRQSSWSKWTFNWRILYSFFRNNTVYFVFRRNEGDGDGAVFTLEKMELSRPNDPSFDYAVCLDAKQYHTLGSTTLNLGYSGASFVGPLGEEVIPDSEGSGLYTFDAQWVGEDLVSGLKYTRSLTPTMPHIKDREGMTVSSAKLTISKFLVSLDDTGYVNYELTSPYRDTIVQNLYTFPSDDNPLDPEQTQLYTGRAEVFWGERSDYSELRIYSDDVRPTTILEIEWEGHVTGMKRRV